jgi:hypothetical protein
MSDDMTPDNTAPTVKELTVQFKIDENLTKYLCLYNWLKTISFPTDSTCRNVLELNID